MIRVFVADDHSIFREGVRRVLEAAADIEVVGECGTVVELLARAARPDDPWDVLLLDLSMPGGGGVEALRRVRPLRPELRVVILSMFPEEQYAPRLLRAGASAYVTKERTAEELVGAIRAAVSGRPAASAPRAGAEPAPPHEALSAREHQIFLLVAQGHSTSQIAAELHVTASTVSTHLARIKQRLGAASQGDLVRYAARYGLLDPLQPE